jgi:hypothetical protein
MKLFNTKTQESFEARIIELNSKDYQVIRKSDQFDFDWEEEKALLVYKLLIGKEKEILGLMSLIDMPKSIRAKTNN